ncbi:TetR/AcrR family transcriptional regulator [Mariniflexile sp.]|uniref:TetR/AcrR family transcriptional regulator n=1 Tax=Mariniflexile sp. TaxID=1979402 RepID=UPI003564590B
MCGSKKNIIIQKSCNLFFNYGIQHITMDDIATECGVSKKTIYKHFENKTDLLHKVIKIKAEELKQLIKNNQLKNLNPIEELLLFFKHINHLALHMSPTFGKELKQFHSNIFIEVYRYKNSIVLPFVIENIKKGKNEGLYKADLDPEEICYSFDNVSKIIFTDGFLSVTNKKSIDFINSLFMYRLVSVKGLEYLKGVNTSIV